MTAGALETARMALTVVRQQVLHQPAIAARTLRRSSSVESEGPSAALPAMVRCGLLAETHLRLNAPETAFATVVDAIGAFRSANHQAIDDATSPMMLPLAAVWADLAVYVGHEDAVLACRTYPALAVRSGDRRRVLMAAALRATAVYHHEDGALGHAELGRVLSCYRGEHGDDLVDRMLAEARTTARPQPRVSPTAATRPAPERSRFRYPAAGYARTTPWLTVATWLAGSSFTLRLARPSAQGRWHERRGRRQQCGAAAMVPLSVATQHRRRRQLNPSLSQVSGRITREETPMANKRNKDFEDHRLVLWSPTQPGIKMSRAELAAAVNRKLAQLYPNRRSLRVTARWIKDVELGNTTWPGPERRRALRIVLGVSSDAKIGLFDSHPRNSVAAGDGPLQTAADPGQPTDVPAPSLLRRTVADRRTRQVGQQVDWTVPRAGRVYDYLLGGKDHRAPDRAMGQDLLAAFPTARTAAAATRAFLQRAVRILTGEGIHQFLDIGAGIPLPGCTHEIAQSIAPVSRVVYVDIDPVVMQHIQARHVSHPAGHVDHVQADVRDPQTIFDSAAVRGTLDLRQPVAVLLGAVVHHIPDDEDAATAVKQLLAPLPTGSFLVISHATTDFSDHDQVAVYEQMYAAGRTPVRARSKPAIGNYLHGLNLVEPGLVPVAAWNPDAGTTVPRPEEIGMYGVVGRVR
ncbi:SAM-dependent methyltransferase [Actinoplanes sp. NPDC020271]|uniref:SAM-dependent methyltransferase n=1 Tax=Actinoplanes sp. NPDC020271 TaxID=3363896 RepID=UPI0037AEE6B3